MANDTIKLSYNPRIIDKPQRGDSVQYATGFIDADVSVDEFIDLIKKGYAFTAQFKNNYRKTENFICSDFIAVDIDEGMSVDDALKNEYLKENALFIYTTPSHTDEKNRFRIVFRTPSTVTHKDIWRRSLQGAGRKFGGDPAIKDGASLFYGNRDAKFYKIGKRLTEKAFKEIEELAFSKVGQAIYSPISYQTSLTVSLEDFITTSNGEKRQLKELSDSVSIFCPKHIDKNTSAFTLSSQQGVRGIHCVACRATFWTEPLKKYKFNAFEEFVGKIEKEQHQVDKTEENYFGEEDCGIKVVRYEEKYLPQINYRRGITLVRSPKGSGKTAALKKLVEGIKAFSRTSLKNDYPRSILLIGHRQTLLREACNKLGLDCYLDSEPTHFYGVSLDSIGTKLNRSTGLPPYDLILIDESEQVFSHLTSETIATKAGGLANVFKHLQYYISVAKSVIALDADLDIITLKALEVLKNDGWNQNLRIIWNIKKADNQKRPIFLYRSRGHLIEEMIASLKRGEKCLITSNSKNRIDDIYLTIKKQIGGKYIKVTSENSQEETVIDFVKNINHRAKEYDAILASPSLGTGVDITFPNNAVVYQNVYGFFESFVNTHTDIDQQLARVRHTNNIKIHINPRFVAVETDVNLILESLGRGNISDRALEITHRGEYKVDHNDPLLQIYAQVIAYQSASKSNIRKNFFELKKKQEVEIIEIFKNEKEGRSGNRKLRLSRQERIDTELDRFMKAPPLTEEEFYHLYAQKISNERISKNDKVRLDKHLVEKAFKNKPDRDTLKRIIDGQFIEKIENLKKIRSDRYVEVVQGYAFSLVSEGSVKEYLRKTSIEGLIGIVLVLCGFVKDARLDLNHTISQSDLGPFVRLCQSNNVMIGQILGNPIRKDVAARALLSLNPILSKAGLVLEKRNVRKKTGKASTVYGFDPKKLKRMDEYLSNYTPITDRSVFEEAGFVKSDGELDYKGFKDRYGTKKSTFSKKIDRVKPI